MKETIWNGLNKGAQFVFDNIYLIIVISLYLRNDVSSPVTTLTFIIALIAIDIYYMIKKMHAKTCGTEEVTVEISINETKDEQTTNH